MTTERVHADYIITRNVSGFAKSKVVAFTQSELAGSIKKKETENTSGSDKTKSTAEYMKELEKLAPSVEFKAGNSYSTAKNGKTLTISPQLLEKMQNDPEQEKETKEMIKGVESMTKLVDGINKASGWTVVFRHSYIDENGKYCEIALVRNDYMLNMSDKLREERRKNSEKLIEKTKEKAAEKKEDIEGKNRIKRLEEKETAKTEEETGEKAEEKSAYDKAEQLINEKVATSKDGTIYLNDTDFWTIVEAAKEDQADKATIKEQPQVGANLDLKI